MEGYDGVKTPFGPLNCEEAIVKELIGKEILYANHKEGLGAYGTLVSIHPDLLYPYKVISHTSPYDRPLYAIWIVEHSI